MSAAGIYLNIDGQPVDLDEVSWYEKAPCGCVCGVHVAYSDYGSGPAWVIATEQQADERMWENKAIREKYQALGFKHFPDLTSKCVELMQNCPHEPKWGYEKAPKPEGHTWAAVHALGSRPKLMHLVPDIGVENARERRYGIGDTAALCGSKAFHWKDEWYALDGKVECKRCIQKATA